MERDRRILEFLERRNGKALRLAAHNGKLARRVLTTKLRGGVGVGTGRQRDGACAARGLIGRAGFLVREHKGRALGSKRKVHRRELDRFEVLEIDVICRRVIICLILERQRISGVQVDGIVFPFLAVLELLRSRTGVVLDDLEHVVARIHVRQHVKAQAHILRRRKGDCLCFVAAGRGFEVVTGLILDRLPRVGRIVRRRNAFTVLEEVGEDELAGQRLRFRDRAARYREAARHIVAVRVRDGVGVAAVRKRRGVFSLECAHGGRAALDGDRVVVRKSLGELDVERHALAGKLLELDGPGNVRIRDLDRARCAFIAEGRRFIGVRTGRDDIFAVRASDGLARRVLERQARVRRNGRKLDGVEPLKCEVLEPDAVLAGIAAGVLPEGQQLLFARLKQEAHLRPFGLIVLCGVEGVAAKQQIVVVRFGVGLVPEADISGRCVILQLDGDPDLGVAHALALGLERAFFFVVCELLILAGIARVVAVGDRRVRTKLLEHVGPSLNLDLIGNALALVGKQYIGRSLF